MTPEVSAAIEEIHLNFPKCELDQVGDGQGGAFLTLDSVSLGAPYLQMDTWFGFQITHTCPYGDVYPHFVRRDLSRLDKQPLGDGMSPGNFNGREAIQISRRTNKQVIPNSRTPLLKLLKVLEWLKRR